jgi:hypothetical protein
MCLLSDIFFPLNSSPSNFYLCTCFKHIFDSLAINTYQIPFQYLMAPIKHV